MTRKWCIFDDCDLLWEPHGHAGLNAGPSYRFGPITHSVVLNATQAFVRGWNGDTHLTPHEASDLEREALFWLSVALVEHRAATATRFP